MNRLYIIAALSLALCISLVTNIWQYRSDLIEDTEAPLKAQIDSFTVTEQINVAVSKARAADGAELERLRKQVADKQVETVTQWRTTVKTLPAATCSPGHERVAAWNTLALGSAP